MDVKRVLAAGSVAIVLSVAVVTAGHSWGTYHWARTTPSFDLVVVNSTTPDWDPFVAAAVADWSKSHVLNLVEDTSGSSSKGERRKCQGPTGQIRICNDAYGNNGWLGVAGISLDPAGHIVTGYTKLNDTYFSLAYYNTPDWKQSVTCQERGHNIGLDHQDEDFNNVSLFSCMDYQDPPFPWANQHDFDQLETIYAHLDAYDSYVAGGGGGDGGGGGCNAPPGKGCNKAGVGQRDTGNGWGRSLGRRGNGETFIRVDPDGTSHVTFVTWVDGH